MQFYEEADFRCSCGILFSPVATSKCIHDNGMDGIFRLVNGPEPLEVIGSFSSDNCLNILIGNALLP